MRKYKLPETNLDFHSRITTWAKTEIWEALPRLEKGRALGQQREQSSSRLKDHGSG